MGQPHVPPPAPDGPEVDLDLARQLFEGDETTLRFVAAVFVDEAAGQIEALREAVGTGDPRKVADAAHRLKGSVALFGARRATDLAERLQRVGARGAMDEAPRLVDELQARVVTLVAELEALLTQPEAGARGTAAEPVARGGRG